MGAIPFRNHQCPLRAPPPPPLFIVHVFTFHEARYQKGPFKSVRTFWPGCRAATTKAETIATEIDIFISVGPSGRNVGSPFQP
jgi:hypothetical protein